MDKAQKILFDGFPRFVGNPNQFCVFDEKTFDLFVENNEGEANCYARISTLSRTGTPMLDRVFLDLDGEVHEDMTEKEMVRQLREDSEFRASVLGAVCEDAQSVAELCREHSIPLVGVYTGKGIHLHAFYEERESPERELVSNTEWMIDEAGVSTFDRAVLGDVKRLCRVPNCRRFDGVLMSPTDLWTVPLSQRELESITPKKLAEWSREPRQIEKPGESRPPFFVRQDEEYEPSVEPEKVEREPLGVAEAELNEKMEKWVADLLQLPCLYERIKTNNPAHSVRLASAIMMYNAGLERQDIVEVFSRFGWADFSPKKTRKFLKSIERKGYASMSCATLQSKGLCVFEQGSREEECDKFGYSGGDSFF